MSQTTTTSVTNDEIRRLFDLQRRHHQAVKSTTASERVAKLLRLREAIVAHEAEVMDALALDLRRPRAVKGEIGAVLGDIDDAVAHLKRWMAPVEVEPSLPVPGAKARILYEPRGVCALFGPWNFPVLLVLQPLVPMVAAGNCVIVKPNDLTPASSRVTAKIIRASFDECEVAVVEGGIDTAEAMQALPFDHVFLTGSPAVGRRVMAAAARHLTSVTLELGGKSPVVIDETADLARAADKVAVGRCLNAGQLCLAPDHVWIKAGLRDTFLDHLRLAVQRMFYRDGFLNKEAFGRIVNRQNFLRLQGYVEDARARGAKLAFGGEFEADDLTVHPCALIDVPLQARVMQEEIFGPILPVMTWDDPAEVCEAINANGKPLALYIFSRDSKLVDRIVANTSSGGVTVNDILMHAVESRLPFGGVNGSGMGRYHGIHGFKELSHERSVFIA